ncbi:NYN domain-containing protein [Gordonia sp. (in: high G+C Gram-positive bacteria)]|uniref:NYN domain-containing protein n=1 Tax=Gordonia sp. (in: high G+C Gram-positive bacteria) TaxID=84139 RepID=UPI0039E557F1
MRSTACVYIDAGYLLAAAATRITGTSLRSGIVVEYPSLIQTLADMATELSGLPLLRVHWYDSAHNGVPDQRQERIGELPKVKLRLGRFGYGGEQKGVDLRIGLDLVNSARNGAADVIFLVSGDDDLTEAVEEAQIHGVQVVVLAIPNAAGRAHGISRHLLRAVDEMHIVDGVKIDGSVTKVERKTPETEDEETGPRTTVTPAEVAARPGPPKPGPATSGPKPGPAPRPTPGSIPKPGPKPSPIPQPSATLAYSSATGQEGQVMPGYDFDTDDELENIEAICERVLSSFLECRVTGGP